MAAAAYFLLLGEWDAPNGQFGEGLEIIIPTWREALREGLRGLASGREKLGEMLGRWREVRSRSDLWLGVVRGDDSQPT